MDTLPYVVAHEVVHVQQLRAGSRASQGTPVRDARAFLEASGYDPR